MIELVDVSRTVTSGAGSLTILQPTSFRIDAGRAVAITGPSGSGKSTLLGLIAGLDAPSTGRILIGDTDITRLGEEALARLRGEQIGIVFQFFHLLPSLTALENVLVPMEIANLPDARARAAGLLADVGLSDRGHHYPSQLSGGEQQRVALARALANDPPILLADEPTGNLDTTNGHHILELLRGIHRARGTTLVLVTHDRELAEVAEARTIAPGEWTVTPGDPTVAVAPNEVWALDHTTYPTVYGWALIDRGTPDVLVRIERFAVAVDVEAKAGRVAVKPRITAS